MRIAFDLDNTLVDELGKSVRPGMHALLAKLRAQGHTLILFTQSTKARAVTILRDHKLDVHFHELCCREDWDEANANPAKDLRVIRGDALIDDDPGHVAAAKKLGKRGILVRPYRGGHVRDATVAQIEAALTAGVGATVGSWFHPRRR